MDGDSERVVSDLYVSGVQLMYDVIADSKHGGRRPSRLFRAVWSVGHVYRPR